MSRGSERPALRLPNVGRWLRSYPLRTTQESNHSSIGRKSSTAAVAGQQTRPPPMDTMQVGLAFIMNLVFDR